MTGHDDRAIHCYSCGSRETSLTTPAGPQCQRCADIDDAYDAYDAERHADAARFVPTGHLRLVEALLLQGVPSAAMTIADLAGGCYSLQVMIDGEEDPETGHPHSLIWAGNDDAGLASYGRAHYAGHYVDGEHVADVYTAPDGSPDDDETERIDRFAAAIATAYRTARRVVPVTITVDRDALEYVAAAIEVAADGPFPADVVAAARSAVEAAGR